MYGKMNRYVAVFSVFLVAIVVVFLLLRTDFVGESVAQEPASGAETSQEAVLVKKGEMTTKAQQKLLQNTSGDFYMGNEFAPVIMIEYASLSCPHCAHFHEDVLNDLLESHVKTGKVKYVFRDFPLNQQALDASKLSMCGDKDSYFNFIKVLFKSQENWAYTPTYLDTLKNIAHLGGIDEAKFNECLADPKIEEKILEVKKDAIEILGVNSTPTIFINGIEYQGPREYEDVSKYINSLLTASTTR